MYLLTKLDSEFTQAYAKIVEQLTDEELLFEIGQAISRKDAYHPEALAVLNEQFLSRGITQ